MKVLASLNAPFVLFASSWLFSEDDRETQDEFDDGSFTSTFRWANITRAGGYYFWRCAISVNRWLAKHPQTPAIVLTALMLVPTSYFPFSTTMRLILWFTIGAKLLHKVRLFHHSRRPVSAQNSANFGMTFSSSLSPRLVWTTITKNYVSLKSIRSIYT